MGTLRAESGRRGKLRPAVRTPPRQGGRALLAEFRARMVIVLAPRTLHAGSPLGDPRTQTVDSTPRPRGARTLARAIGGSTRILCIFMQDRWRFLDPGASIPTTCAQGGPHGRSFSRRSERGHDPAAPRPQGRARRVAQRRSGGRTREASFDHMLGWLGPSKGGPPPDFSNPDAAGKAHPVQTTFTTALAFDPPHGNHGSVARQVDFNEKTGRYWMDGFVKEFERRRDGRLDERRPPWAHADLGLVMSQYHPAAVPAYRFLAQNHLVCARYFSSVQSGTWVNRMLFYAGTSNGIVDSPEGTLIRGKEYAGLPAPLRRPREEGRASRRRLRRPQPTGCSCRQCPSSIPGSRRLARWRRWSHGPGPDPGRAFRRSSVPSPPVPPARAAGRTDRPRTRVRGASRGCGPST
jgi:hypothetical protein